VGLISLPYLFIEKKVKKVYSIFLAIIILPPVIIDLSHLLLFKKPIEPTSLFAIYSTNKKEVVEFIASYFSIYLIFVIGFLFLVIYVLIYINSKTHYKRSISIFHYSYLILSILILITTLPRFSKNYLNEISFVKIANTYINYKKELKKMVILGRSHLIKDIKVSRKTYNNSETHIIIIGESTSTYHMKLYGYERNTNPRLQEIKHELSVFNNVNSSAVESVASLKDVFLLKNKNNKNTLYTLIDCLNAAGFETFWLSNQNYIGEHCTPITLIGERSKHVYFINNLHINNFDENIFPKLDEVIAYKKRKKIIVVHLMGSHVDYKYRYPKRFKNFTDSPHSAFGEKANEIINHYDNSILYNDYIVEKIIRKIRQLSGLNSVLFFADHGDEVYDKRDFFGHNKALTPSKYMSSVPFILWRSSLFEKEKNIAINNKKQYSLKDFSHTYQDLLGINSTFFIKEKSFFYREN